MAYIEEFALTQSVAANGCGAASIPTLGRPGYGSKSTCGWNMGGIVMWVDSAHGCDLATPTDKPVDGVCYNNPNNGAAIFNLS